MTLEQLLEKKQWTGQEAGIVFIFSFSCSLANKELIFSQEMFDNRTKNFTPLDRFQYLLYKLLFSSIVNHRTITRGCIDDQIKQWLRLEIPICVNIYSELSNKGFLKAGVDKSIVLKVNSQITEKSVGSVCNAFEKVQNDHIANMANIVAFNSIIGICTKVFSLIETKPLKFDLTELTDECDGLNYKIEMLIDATTYGTEKAINRRIKIINKYFPKLTYKIVKVPNKALNIVTRNFKNLLSNTMDNRILLLFDDFFVKQLRILRESIIEKAGDCN